MGRRLTWLDRALTSAGGQKVLWVLTVLSLAVAVLAARGIDTHVDLVRLQAAHAQQTNVPDEVLIIALEPADEAVTAAHSAAMLAMPGVLEVVPRFASAPPDLTRGEARRLGLRHSTDAMVALAVRVAPGTSDANVLAAAQAVPLPPGLTRTLGGLPALDHAHAQSARTELSWRLPLVAAALALTLWLLTGSVVGTGLPLLAASSACLILVGVLGAQGLSLGGPHQLLVPLVLVFGLADSVHLQRQVAVERRLQPVGYAAVLTALRRVARPCMVTSVTTALGFLALEATSSPVLHTFGRHAAVGIAVAYGIGLGLPALVLCTFPSLCVERPTRLARAIGQPAPLSPPASLGALAVLTGLCALGIPQLEQQIRLGGELHPDSPALAAHRRLDKALKGMAPLTLTFTADDPDDPRWAFAYAQHADALRTPTATADGRTASTLGAHLGPGAALQIVEARTAAGGKRLSLANLSRNPSTPMPIRRKTWRTVQAQVNAAVGTQLFTPTGAVAQLRLRDQGARAWSEWLNHAQRSLPPGLQMTASGWPVVAAAAYERLLPDLAQLVGATLLATLLATGALLRRPGLALLGAVPTVLTAGLALAVLGLTGVPLAPPNLFVVSAGVGLGIDALVHLLTTTPDTPAAQATEGAVLWTTLLLLVGLAALATSPLPTLGALGSTLALTMIGNLLAVWAVVGWVRRASPQSDLR